jgi:serine/threonine-protein kinase HipA
MIPVNRLEVWRRYTNGQSLLVGHLAQNRQGIYFQYDNHYLKEGQDLSPFFLKFDSSLQQANPQFHQGIFGIFADSIPDGWGLLLMDRIFRQTGLVATQITPMDRLTFVGDRGMGALSYKPAIELQKENQTLHKISELGLEAQAIFDGQTSEVLSALVNAGSSCGARPKAQLYLYPDKENVCSTRYLPGTQAYLVKFTSRNLSLGHEEGLCEAVYLSLAAKAGIDVAEWTLLDAPKKSGAKQWLVTKRFDTHIKNEQEGRLHLHSASGLLNADFRLPSLDYLDLIKASSSLCKSPVAGQIIFRRAVFNLFALNQDDHSKNWSFLQKDNGDWQISPAYDITFSPSAYGEHMTAFAGFGKQPSKKTFQLLAAHANYADWQHAQKIIQQVLDALTEFCSTAKTIGLSSDTIKLISRQLNQVYEDNKGLLET